MDITTQKVYMGYINTRKYKNKLIAISSNKEIVKSYLESHRGLTKNQYYIESEYYTESELLLKYGDHIISEFEGYYIPEIDQEAIQMNSTDIGIEIISCFNALKHITLLSSEIKKFNKSDLATLLDALKILNTMQKKNKMLTKLEIKNMSLDTLLFCDIDEYFSKISSYKNTREMNQRYKYALYD